jgi:hypothetical protein
VDPAQNPLGFMRGKLQWVSATDLSAEVSTKAELFNKIGLRPILHKLQISPTNFNFFNNIFDASIIIKNLLFYKILK